MSYAKNIIHSNQTARSNKGQGEEEENEGERVACGTPVSGFFASFPKVRFLDGRILMIAQSEISETPPIMLTGEHCGPSADCGF